MLCDCENNVNCPSDKKERLRVIMSRVTKEDIIKAMKYCCGDTKNDDNKKKALLNILIAVMMLLINTLIKNLLI